MYFVKRRIERTMQSTGRKVLVSKNGNRQISNIRKSSKPTLLKRIHSPKGKILISKTARKDTYFIYNNALHLQQHTHLKIKFWPSSTVDGCERDNLSNALNAT